MKIVENNNGKFITNADVKNLIVENGVIKGAKTEEKEYKSKYVLANVTPHQLYQELLQDTSLPKSLQSDVRNYDYGNAAMQIHYALDTSLNWENPELNKVAMINLTSGVEGVSQSVNEAYNGLLPKEGTIAVGQHTAFDPSRAPDGKHTLWIQLLEMPHVLKGDALGEIVTTNGYTKEVLEAYVDRIEKRIVQHAPNFKEAIINRKIISPVQLESANRNLVGEIPILASLL